MPQIRLNKYIASIVSVSRRTADGLIQTGQVIVNSKKAILGQLVDPGIDKIVCGSQIIIKKNNSPVYVILNKPAGYVTTSKSQSGQKTVYDLINLKQRLFSVGRLDKDTTGLLLLTNDGDLTQILTHPKYEKSKVYRVQHSGASYSQLQEISKGIPLDNIMTREANVVPKSAYCFQITIHEGKNRQIRKMCSYVGINITSLHRLSFHNLALGSLASGQWRYLTSAEISLLQA